MSGKYISRAAAINRIMENIVHQDSHDVNLHNIGLRKAMSAIDSLPAADVVERTRWIPVTERLPESGTRALVMRFDFVTNTPFYDLLWFDKGEWWNRRYTGDYAVTHWQPLPEPPKEETPTGPYDLLYEDGGPDA